TGTSSATWSSTSRQAPSRQRSTGRSTLPADVGAVRVEEIAIPLGSQKRGPPAVFGSCGVGGKPRWCVGGGRRRSALLALAWCARRRLRVGAAGAGRWAAGLASGGCGPARRGAAAPALRRAGARALEGCGARALGGGCGARR